jgi:hypothetical protein
MGGAHHASPSELIAADMRDVAAAASPEAAYAVLADLGYSPHRLAVRAARAWRLLRGLPEPDADDPLFVITERLRAAYLDRHGGGGRYVEALADVEAEWRARASSAGEHLRGLARVDATAVTVNYFRG